MRPPAALLFVLGMIASAITPTTPRSQSQSTETTLFESWRQSVLEHEPGRPDESARRIAGWPRSDLLRTMNGIRRQRDRLPRALLNRGAVLHLDIEILFSPVAVGILFPDRSPRSGSGSPLLALDGRSQGRGSRSSHLDFARALLDVITRDRHDNETGELWYVATAAYLAAKFNLAESLPHLEKARDLYADSPLILLASGCLNEAFASSRVQSVARGRRQAVPIGSERENLRRAEGHFRDALKLDPGLAEARLRLGFVLGQRGAHRDAIRELEQALKVLPDDEGRYLALLFMARENEMLGRSDEASRHYQKASALFPRAQTPFVALSRLAYHDGRGRDAERILQQLFKLPDAENERSDPWWDYYGGLGRFADALLARLRERAAQEVM